MSLINGIENTQRRVDWGVEIKNAPQVFFTLACWRSGRQIRPW